MSGSGAAGPAPEGGAVEVRPVTDAEVPDYRAAVDEVAREHRWLARTEAPPLEDARSFVAQLAARGVPLQVAVDERRVVGWCDVTPKDWPGCEHVGVLGMGLLMPYRGRGLGRRLLDAALLTTSAAGLTRVQLDVWARNTAAITLYERAGFQHEGLRRRFRHLDGITDDLVLMARLDPPFAAEGST